MTDNDFRSLLIGMFLGVPLLAVLVLGFGPWHPKLPKWPFAPQAKPTPVAVPHHAPHR